MRLDSCGHLAARPAFLSRTQFPYDGLLRSPDRFADVLRETDMDVLSEVLKVVKLQGALFYNGEFSSPWSVYAAPSRELARYFGIDTEHVIVYHFLTEGRGSVRLENGDRLALGAGDIV